MVGLRASHRFSATILDLLRTVPCFRGRPHPSFDARQAPWDPSLDVIMDWDLYLGFSRKGATFHHVALPRRSVPDARRSDVLYDPVQGATTRVRQRYGIPAEPLESGRMGARFIGSASSRPAPTFREFRARSLRGRDTRWFNDDVGAASIDALLARCYGDHLRNHAPSPSGGTALRDDIVEVQPTRGVVRLGLGELWRYRDLVFFFAWRDVKVRYKQTLFGGAWAVIQPLVLMVVFTFVFGRVLKVQTPPGYRSRSSTTRAWFPGRSSRRPSPTPR